jgi:hypothetical protein
MLFLLRLFSKKQADLGKVARLCEAKPLGGATATHSRRVFSKETSFGKTRLEWVAVQCYIFDLCLFSALCSYDLYREISLLSYPNLQL